MHAKSGQNQVKNSVFDLIRGPVVKKYVWPSRARLKSIFSRSKHTRKGPSPSGKKQLLAQQGQVKHTFSLCPTTREHVTNHPGTGTCLEITTSRSKPPGQPPAKWLKNTNENFPANGHGNDRFSIGGPGGQSLSVIAFLFLLLWSEEIDVGSHLGWVDHLGNKISAMHEFSVNSGPSLACRPKTM